MMAGLSNTSENHSTPSLSNHVAAIRNEGPVSGDPFQDHSTRSLALPERYAAASERWPARNHPRAIAALECWPAHNRAGGISNRHAHVATLTNR